MDCIGYYDNNFTLAKANKLKIYPYPTTAYNV